MSTAAQHATDVAVLAQAVLKAQKRDHGCEQPCDCSICFPTRKAIGLLEEAQREAS